MSEIKLYKKNGNVIDTKYFSNQKDFENNKICGCGVIRIGNINEKHFISEIYCRQFCNKCYAFGCDWDIRCNENNKPIGNVVTECDKFKNAKRYYDELIKKMNDDKEFLNFMEIVNANMKSNNYYGATKLEIFLGIFNRK